MKIGRFEATRDAQGWTLTETKMGKDKDGNPKAHTRERYYATLEQCCHKIIDISAAGSDAAQGVIDAITEAKKEILAAIRSAGLK